MCGSADGTISCHPCPEGGDCSPAERLSQQQLESDGDVVISSTIVAQAGYWAAPVSVSSPSSLTSSESSSWVPLAQMNVPPKFFKCPVPAACVPSSRVGDVWNNGSVTDISRTECAVGYTNIACSVCRYCCCLSSVVG